MKKEDIAHLARLARIRLEESELATYEADLSSIVSYVSSITEIASESDLTAPTVGSVYNVFREDAVTVEPGEFTEALMAEMPETEGQYMKVKKILKVG